MCIKHFPWMANLASNRGTTIRKSFLLAGAESLCRTKVNLEHFVFMTSASDFNSRLSTLSMQEPVLASIPIMGTTISRKKELPPQNLMLP